MHKAKHYLTIRLQKSITDTQQGFLEAILNNQK